MANRINDWQSLLEFANEELAQYGYAIRVEVEDEGASYCVKVNNGNGWNLYASGFYDDELSMCINDCWASARQEIIGLNKGSELFVYRKVHGWTHDAPALIFSITETALFFRDNDGTIESVDDNPGGIDAYENREGSFCVVADEYDYAFKQIEEHNNNLFN